MSTFEFDRESFRDPAAAVFYSDGRVLRALTEKGAADWAALSRSNFFDALTAKGMVVRTTAVDSTSLPTNDAPGGYAAFLEHERIPFVSYPYEWTFTMLQDAAALQLEVLLASLENGFTMKDGYAFNVQWRGASPTFIDVGSFEPSRGEPWGGYRQFCRTFLYPLLLEAHLAVPFQRFMFGDLEGVEPTDMRRLLRGRKRFAKGVFRNVYLHGVIDARATRSTRDVHADLSRAGFGNELAKALARKLLKLVRSLRSSRTASAWTEYRDVCPYSDADREAKARFVVDAAAQSSPRVVWDLGCNDGTFARLVAPHAEYVVAIDADDVVVDGLYRELRVGGPSNVLPLVVNLVDPSPGRGWRNGERRALLDRGRPDLVLALALVHHLAITANVPLAEVVDWLASFDTVVAVEFVAPDDPMARRLLANKAADIHDQYTTEEFERLLGGRFTVRRREMLPGGMRTMYLVAPCG